MYEPHAVVQNHISMLYYKKFVQLVHIKPQPLEKIYNQYVYRVMTAFNRL